MEVKKGYKQTDVGVIPEDWEVKRLGDIARIQRGASPRPIDSPVWFDENSAVGWVRISDVTKSGMFLYETSQRLSPLGIQQSRPVASGNLIMSICATVGRPIITEINVCIHDGFVVFDNLKADTLFTYYILKRIEPQWSRHGQTGSQMNLNTGLINGTFLPVPPLPEQRAIAEALGDVDALLGAQEKLIAKKRALKQAAMQELLTGKKRLPGFEKKRGYKQTEVGVIPEDWDTCVLKNCLSAPIDYGINAPAVPFSEKLPKYIRITDIDEDGHYLSENPVSVKHKDAERFTLQDGDIVFARTGASVGKSYQYKYYDGKLVFAGFLIRVASNPTKLLPSFLSQYVKTAAYWNWVKLMSMRSGQPGINGNEYGQLPVPLAPLPEQHAIATVLSDMDAEIEALEKRLEKTRMLKQGMMQELLTGKTRLIN